MSRKLTLLVVALVLGAAPGLARAEGPGLKISDGLVLHPGLTFGGGHDSNIEYSAANEQTIFGPYVLVRPFVDLATLSAQRGGGEPHNVDFRLHLGSSLRYIFTGDPTFNREHMSVDVDAAATLSLFPYGPFTFEAFDNFTRSSVPPYFHVQEPGNLNFDQEEFGIRGRIRPGGQRLEVALLARGGLYAFEPDPVSVFFGNKNYLYGDFNARVSFKFFPKTALYINAEETVYHYYLRNDVNTPPDNYPLRITAGLKGLITPTFDIDINGGYYDGFYSIPATCNPTKSPGCDASPQSGSAAVSLHWHPFLLTAISAGYAHNFNVSLIGNYYDYDSAQVGLAQAFWKIVATFRAGWQERRYQGNLIADGQANGRVDDLVTLHLDFQWNVKDWFNITLGDDVQMNFSNCQFILNVNGTPVPSAVACDYKRNDGWLRFTFAY